MNRRIFLTLTGGIAASAIASKELLAAAKEPVKKPNIIVMICHDIGQHLGCYGVSEVNTPSIDRLAAEGVMFKNSFCSSPSCSPSRASIFTGRYPHSNGVMGLTHASFAWDLYPGEKHLCSYLKQAGYKTALAGLQHEVPDVATIGFDHFDASHDMHTGKPLTCDKVAQDASDYISSASKSGEPFYLQAGFFEPHRKFDFGGAVPDDSNGVFIPPYIKDEPGARQEFAGYQGSIKKVDASIGRVLDALANNGISNNTIVIFTSDHGIPFPRAKCSLYDPGIVVPFIIRWPARGWTGGRKYSEMISNIDYLPTLLDAVGAKTAANVQGESFCSLLDNKPYEPRTEIFAEMTYHDYYDPRRAIRTEKFKLIANFTTAHFFMNPSQSYRPATKTNNPVEPTAAYHPYLELYDLETDPLEEKNLIDDVGYSDVKIQLCRKLLGWMKKTDDPLLKGAVTPPHHTEALSRLYGAK